MSEDKVRENRIRRMAERQGFRLEKSRRRDPRAIDHGGYMLVDVFKNNAVLGTQHFAYSANLDDIEQYLELGHTGSPKKAGKISADQSRNV